MKERVKKVGLFRPVDADKISISRDHYFPNAYTIDFVLSSAPDHVWLDLFESEWKSSRHLWDRKLFIMGNKLRLVTTAYDIEDKLDWIKQVLEQTNVRIDKYNRELAAAAGQIRGQIRKPTLKEDEEKASVEMIRETLRKRFGSS
jgi:hypothetical protein